MVHDASATRRRILEAADELFYSEGVRAIGVDRIAEKAGVTKRTLYYHFRSKDDLIAAYLTERDVPTMQRYRRWMEGEGTRMADRITHMFRELARAASDSKWRGCGFLRVAVELADLPGHPARQVAAAHKKRFEAWLAEELRAEEVSNPEARARSLMVVVDGAIAQMIVHKDTSYAEAAAALARMVISQPDTVAETATAPAGIRLASAISETSKPSRRGTG